MRVVVIIVNYRTAGLTIDALASLAPELAAVAPARVVVVDNDSGDGSAERIGQAIEARGWSAWATLLRAERNGGFAYGNNLGLRHALATWAAPRYVHLLNPDTVVRPGAVAALVNFLDAHPEAGIAGSRLEDPDGTGQRSAFRFPGVLGELEAAARIGPISRLLEPWAVPLPLADRPCPVDWVAGASMMIRREVLDEVGPIDERYFMYYEEVDFTLRARRAGWTCWYVPVSRVVHLVGQASGVTDPGQRARRRPDYWFDSRRRYLTSNLGRWRAVMADVAFAAGELAFRARCLVERRHVPVPERLLRDLARHSVLVRGVDR